MAIFTTPQSDQFINLSNVPTDILVAEDHLIQVNGIIVTNKSPQNIQVNLNRSVTIGEEESVVSEIVSNKTVASPFVRQLPQGASSLELLEFPYFLGLNPVGSIDKLICFSNSPTQKFDLQVSYTTLNETPFGGAC